MGLRSGGRLTGYGTTLELPATYQDCAEREHALSARVDRMGPGTSFHVRSWVRVKPRSVCLRAEFPSGKARTRRCAKNTEAGRGARTHRASRTSLW